MLLQRSSAGNATQSPFLCEKNRKYHSRRSDSDYFPHKIGSAMAFLVMGVGIGSMPQVPRLMLTTHPPIPSTPSTHTHSPILSPPSLLKSLPAGAYFVCGLQPFLRSSPAGDILCIGVITSLRIIARGGHTLYRGYNLSLNHCPRGAYFV